MCSSEDTNLSDIYSLLGDTRFKPDWAKAAMSPFILKMTLQYNLTALSCPP